MPTKNTSVSTKKSTTVTKEQEKKLTPAEKTKALKAKRTEEHQKAFLQTLKQTNSILQKFEKSDDKVLDVLTKMGTKVNVKRFSTGSFVLDTITGGGFPYGRIIELYGPESSGKTSIALNAVANVQKEGGNCVYIDAENAFDPHYAQTLGVDVTRLGFSQDQIAENVLTTCYKLAESGTTDLIVVDSLASLSPRAEVEGGMDKQQIGVLARVMSKGCRMLIGPCSEKNCTVIFLNQIRDKVGVMFGNPETTPGGRALKFYASQRIEVRRREIVKENGKEIGTKVRLHVTKNKVAAPFGEGFTVLTFAHGINHTGELVVVGLDKDILWQKNPQSSIYYKPLHPEDPKFKNLSIDKEKVEGNIMYKLSGRGKSNAMAAIADNDDLFKYIADDIKEVLDKEREGIIIDTDNPDVNNDNNNDEEDNEFE